MTDRQPLNELDRDAFKTTAKAFGNRLKDAGIATLGGQKAQGRLSTRIIADKLMKAWLRYEGATDDPATPENVYNFVRRHFGGSINDADMRRAIGVPEVVKPQGPEGAKTPEGNQHISREHFNAAVKKAGGNPNNVTQDHLDQVAAEQPDLVKAAPTPTGPNAPTGQEPPVATPAPTPASTTTPQTPATGAPAAPTPSTAPTTPPAPNAVQTPSQPAQTASGAQSKDANWFANASEAEQDAHWDQVAAQPAPATSQAPPAPAQPPPSTPAPTPAPSQASQTGGLTANRQPILRQRSAPQDEPAPPPSPAPTAAPTQTSSAPGLTPNGQPILRQRSAAQASPVLGQLSNMVAQPNVTPAQIMTALGQAANATKPGTPQRTQLIQFIKKLQNQPNVVAKIPQLGTLSLEAYHPSGRRLTEAESQQTPMQRSTLDRVFMQLAKLMIRQGNTALPNGQTNEPPNSAPTPNEAKPDPAKLRDQFGDRRIATDSIRRALGHNMTTKVATQYKMVTDAMQELGNKTLLKNLLQILEQKYKFPAARMEPEIVKALMTAVTPVT